MNRLHTSVAAFTCAALLSSATLAAAADVECMRPGKDGTVLNLSATASVELANDQAVVNFYAMDTAPTLLEATQKVLKRVNEGLAKVKALDIKAEYETTNLSSYPRYNEPKKGEAAKIVGWEVRQNISGTVKEVDDAAKLAQQAAKYFAFDGVQFSLFFFPQRAHRLCVAAGGALRAHLSFESGQRRLHPDEFFPHEEVFECRAARKEGGGEEEGDERLYHAAPSGKGI